MSEIGIHVKAINLSSTTPSREKKGVTTEKTPQKAPSSSSAEDEDGSPIRHIVCVKKADVKHFEDVEDCFILDFDPFDEPVQLSKLSVSDNDHSGSPDIAVVAGKGQVNKVDVKAINLSSTTPSHEKKGVTTEKTPQKAPSSSSAEDEDGSPIRHIVCVKKADVKHFEDVEDCFILDFDPFDEPVQLSKLSVPDNDHSGSPDIAVVAGKGQVNKIDVKAINLSSTTTSREKKGVTTEKTPQKAPSSSSAEDEDGSQIRHIVCVKNKADVKHFEDVEDCFILDFDPFDEPVQLFKLSVSDNSGSPDIAVVAEKGQVACRDYPHSRHLCVKFPFETTPHESYCELCYCYVCDSAAPCGFWKPSHCHAAAHIGDWKCRRMLMKQQAAVEK